MPLLIALGVIILLFVFFAIATYNKLATARQLIKEAFAGIDTMLKKRFDMVPNLVETVKGYAKHESEVFEKIAQLRSGYMNAQTQDEKMEVANQFSSTLKTLFAVAENYPELKANTNFQQLQTTLETMETEIANSRKYYNGTVRNYNTSLVTFPQNILAGMFGFREEKYFETPEEERQNVSVKF
ncbi:LemA family protein [bacterium]|nr:MAG: LemA family protein [bacterium]